MAARLAMKLRPCAATEQKPADDAGRETLRMCEPVHGRFPTRRTRQSVHIQARSSCRHGMRVHHIGRSRRTLAERVREDRSSACGFVLSCRFQQLASRRTDCRNWDVGRRGRTVDISAVGSGVALLELARHACRPCPTRSADLDRSAVTRCWLRSTRPWSVPASPRRCRRDGRPVRGIRR